MKIPFIGNVTIEKKQRKQRPDTQHIDVVPFVDKYSTYPSAGLTPEKLSETLREADLGNTREQAELFEEILEKDAMLFGMFASRKHTVAKRDYTIVPASKDNIDLENAAFISDILSNIKNWRGCIEGMLDAVPKGYALSQILWKRYGDIIGVDTLEWTHQKHLRFGRPSDPNSSLYEPRRLTLDNLIDGVELERYKWILAIMQARCGHPSRASVMRTCAWNYLFKNFSVKAWVIFAELYGIPLRVGKYPEAQADNQELLNQLSHALSSIGQDASAMIPDSMKIEFIESMTKAANSAIHGDLNKHCNEENSVAVLGHTGAVVATPGRLGAEDQAIEAVYTLAESDAQALDTIINDQLIKPILIFNRGEQKSYPTYKTGIAPNKNIAEVIAKYDGALNKIRIPVIKSDVYEDLGLQEPQEGDEIVMPSTPVQQPGSFSLKNPLSVIMGATPIVEEKKK